METPAERHRLFFALLPDEGVLEAIQHAADGLKRSHKPRGKWTPAERLHLTLVFLGDFPALAAAGVVEHALAAGDDVAMPGFELTLDSASSFSGRRPPWVLRCEQSREHLLPFWRALAVGLDNAGFHKPPEADYAPHVTLLRDADKALEPVAIEPIHWRVDEFALMHSRMGQEREYVALRRWPLG